jgi:uncharacterized delta-60 repeat protein
LEKLEERALPSAGSLDTTFGTAGQVITAFPGYQAIGNDATVLPDGKILVVGQAETGGSSSDFLLGSPTPSYIVLARFNADGSLDTSFGTSGKVITPIGTAFQDDAPHVKVLTNGNILVGTTGEPSGSPDLQFLLVQYVSDGSLDMGFGNGGLDYVYLGSQYSPTRNLSGAFNLAMAVQGDGKIVLGGNEGFDEGTYALVRCKTDGTLDTSFCSGGEVITNWPLSGNVIASLAIQSTDGKILATGGTLNGNASSLTLARYNTDGSLDNTFGAGGKVITNYAIGGPGANGADAYAVTVQSDGKILQAGTIFTNNGNEFALVRYNSDGSLDSAFGGGGVALSDVGGSGLDYAGSLAVQKDGRILLTATRTNGAVQRDFSLERFNPDGSIDSSFGSNGVADTDVGSAHLSLPATLATTPLLADGRILLVGGASDGTAGELALVRYLGDDPQLGAATWLDATAQTLDGQVFTLTVAARDPYRQNVSGYTGTVQFSSSDPSAVLPGSYTYQTGDYGVHVFTATLGTTGSRTISITDGSLTTNLTVNVTQPLTYYVANTDDAGPGSLRDAINWANNHPNSKIDFDIPANDPGHVYYNGSVSEASRTPTIATDDTQIPNIASAWRHSWWSIQLPSGEGSVGLQANAPMTIDGYSQAGAVANSATAVDSDNAILRIEINGSFITPYFWGVPGPAFGRFGLLLASDNVTVRGLVINGCDTPDAPGIAANLHTFSSGINGYASHEVIAGNFIGTDVSGTLAMSDGAGVNLFGGTGYRVGMDPADPCYADRNMISGNSGWGIGFSAPSDFDTIAGNLIGVDRFGNALGNGFAGVAIGWGKTDTPEENTRIGGPDALANDIAFNGAGAGFWGSTVGGAGVWLYLYQSPDPNPVHERGNSIEGNSIHDNTGLGIDLGGGGAGDDTIGWQFLTQGYSFGVTPNDSQGHGGPNDWLDYPVLTSVQLGSTPQISGTLDTLDSNNNDAPYPSGLHYLPCTHFQIDFYATPAADAVGGRQGQYYLGSATVQTDGNGHTAFNNVSISLPPNMSSSSVWEITATATDVEPGAPEFDDTSEFSSPLMLEPTTTTMTASVNPALYGQIVTFTATVSTTAAGAGTPVGNVVFVDSTTGITLGTATLSIGSASLATSSLALGANAITVQYSGASTNGVVFLPSSGGLSQTVLPIILVLDPTAAGALSLSGNAAISLNTGDVVIDSTAKAALTVSGNSQITAASIQVAGGVSKSGNATLNPAATTGAAAVADPLASLTGPSTTGLTNFGSATYSGNGSFTLKPGIYSQISASGNVRLTLSPGLYLIEGGGFTVTGNASVAGGGVTIYNTGSKYPNSGGNFGGITLSSNGTFSLTAPTSGPYAGVVIFQSRANTRALSLSGNAAAGLAGTLYAPSAQLLVSGNATVNGSLVLDKMSASGNGASTVVADGSGGSPLDSASVGTLLAGDVRANVNDPAGYFTPDELNRIQDAITAWDSLLAPYSVTITQVSDPTLANVVIDDGTSSAAGSATDGVLGSYSSSGEITILQGWNWYAGADPTGIAANQYDFQTVITHELGHALGLGGSANASSPMYEVLAAGVVRRQPSAADLNVPEAPDGADAERAAAPDPTAGFEQPDPDASGHESLLLAGRTNAVTWIAQSSVDLDAGNGRLTAGARLLLKFDTTQLQAMLEGTDSVDRLPRDARSELRVRADESLRRASRTGREEGLRNVAWITEQLFQQSDFSGVTSQAAIPLGQALGGKAPSAVDRIHTQGNRAETIGGPACPSMGQATNGIQTEFVDPPAEALSSRDMYLDALFALWAAGLGLAIQGGEPTRDDNRLKGRV